MQDEAQACVNRRLEARWERADKPGQEHAVKSVKLRKINDGVAIQTNTAASKQYITRSIR
jgi:hypothetical protein